MDVFGGLNEQQSAAVRATEGFVRVIAGAGSGKTRLLVNRYAYLVDDYGIDPANILCVTFTNKAAAEMRRRINSILGDGYDTSLICTYHGFCARLLREDPEKLYLPKDFRIIDESMQRSMLEEIYQKYDLRLDYASFGAILKKISRFKADTSYVESMCSPRKCQIYPSCESVEDKIIEDFLQRQKSTYSLDFTDLISFALYLLTTNAEVREKWQERLNYIQVDEFQDSSRREMQLVDILCDRYRNLLIVGDPDQNIYEWRGSDVKLLVEFDRCHEPTETIFLNRNYRSTPQILKCANSLIDKNELRIKKDLYTLTQPGADVVHFHAKSDSLEAEAICDEIARLKREASMRNSDIAILYRSGFLSRVIEKRLVEVGIPYEIYGGVRFYQRMEVLDLIAYLRVIAYGDDASLKRIINTPRRRFGRSKLTALCMLKDDIQPLGAPENPNLYELLKLHLNDSIFASSRAAEFVSFVEDMRARRGSMRISELVRTVTTDSGYEQFIRELGDEERLENLAEFKRMADEFEKNFGEELTLEDFLNQLAIQSGETSDEDKDTVKLMTIHAAKGLEFPAVFVTGFSEGIFPSSKTIEERRRPGLEEERRLCYVALTRAMRHLYLTDSEGASQNGTKKLPSRFLYEIGRENYIRIGEIPDELEGESRRYIERHSGAYIEPPRLTVGERVAHHIFGDGIIIAVDERRRSFKVRFEQSGQVRNISEDYFTRRQNQSAGALPPNQTNIIESSAADSWTRGTDSVESGVGTEIAYEKIANIESSASDLRDISAQTESNVSDVSDTSAQTESNASDVSDTSAQTESNVSDVSDTSAQAESNISDVSDTSAQTESNVSDVSDTSAQAESNISDVSDTSAQTESNESDVHSTSLETELPATEIGAQAAQTEPDEFTADEMLTAEIADTADTADNGAQSDETIGIASDSEFVKAGAVSEQLQIEFGGMGAAGTDTDRDSLTDAVDTVSSEPDASGNEKLIAPVDEMTENLWNNPNVPHSGWVCVGITDLGVPSGICQMCGHQIIRYVHHMIHPNYRSLGVGCICAGKMEGDVERAKKRERDYKNRAARLESFRRRSWKNSRKGNPYLRINHRVAVLYYNKQHQYWSFAIDNSFSSGKYKTREEAVDAVFAALEERK